MREIKGNWKIYSKVDNDFSDSFLTIRNEEKIGYSSPKNDLKRFTGLVYQFKTENENAFIQRNVNSPEGAKYDSPGATPGTQHEQKNIPTLALVEASASFPIWKRPLPNGKFRSKRTQKKDATPPHFYICNMMNFIFLNKV